MLTRLGTIFGSLLTASGTLLIAVLYLSWYLIGMGLMSFFVVLFGIWGVVIAFFPVWLVVGAILWSLW